MTQDEQLRAALAWIERERQRWLTRPLTDEEAEEFQEIKYQLTLDTKKFPVWAKYRVAAVEEVYDFFADTRGQELFSALLEAIMKEEPKTALDILEKAIAVVAKARIRDRM